MNSTTMHRELWVRKAIGSKSRGSKFTQTELKRQRSIGMQMQLWLARRGGLRYRLNHLHRIGMETQHEQAKGKKEHPSCKEAHCNEEHPSS